MFHMKQLESALISTIFQCYRKAYNSLKDARNGHFLDAEKYFAAAVFMENEIFSKINNRRLTNLAIAHIITNTFNKELRGLLSKDTVNRPYVELLFSIYESIPELKQYEDDMGIL